jgi:hypothetical protein
MRPRPTGESRTSTVVGWIAALVAAAAILVLIFLFLAGPLGA